MRRFRLEVSFDAQQDLRQIVQRLADEGGLALARRWSKKLREKSLTLRALPYQGACITGSLARRRLVVSPYLIVYTVADLEDLVVVLRILDGRRDLPPILGLDVGEFGS